MPRQVLDTDMAKLMQNAYYAAAAAREAGDMEEYEIQKARGDALARLYRGYGSVEDELELVKARESPLQQIGNIAKWGTLLIAAGAAFMLAGKARGGSSSW